MGLPSGGGLPRSLRVQIELTDTTSERHMGAFEVAPGSHRPDAVGGRPDECDNVHRNPDSVVVPVSVPAGTVNVYSARVLHRGGENLSDRDRVFVTLHLMEEGSQPPAGLIYTFRKEDIGKWSVVQTGLESRFDKEQDRKPSIDQLF